MYWVKNDDGNYEVLDGQQRTLSICRFLDHKYAIVDDFGDKQYEDTLYKEDKQQILNYDLEICVCEGTEKEILEWFQTINIKGSELNEQEALNATHTGPWLSDAKRHFSKPNCAAYGLGKDYVNGSVERQDYLRIVLKWISDDNIQEYMATHRHDKNAEPLWQYFQDVIRWVQATFLDYRKEMKGVDWGRLYNQYKDADLDPEQIAKQVTQLMADEEVQAKKGIYEYILDGDERHLKLRTFDDVTKRSIYEQQRGICPYCNKHFEFEQMHADHIKPWSAGGKTTPDNCQMLCRDCNLKKSNQL